MNYRRPSAAELFSFVTGSRKCFRQTYKGVLRSCAEELFIRGERSFIDGMFLCLNKRFVNKLALKDNTMSYCFIFLFLYVADPAIFYSFKQCPEDPTTACLFTNVSEFVLFLRPYLSLNLLSEMTHCPFKFFQDSDYRLFSLLIRLDMY